MTTVSSPQLALDIARELVRIPSVNPGYDPASPGEATISRWLEDWASAQGFECRTEDVFHGRPNVILTVRNGADHPRFLLNGHTDTVSVAGMTIDPFSGDVRDGELYGRGSADMKGPLACMMETLLRLRETPDTWKGTVVFAAVMDEECGFEGIRHFLKGDADFDFAVVGEPTRLQIIRGCKGCLRFYVRAKGQSAHSSTPEKGRSAIVAMAQAILALDRMFAEELSQIRHPDFSSSTGSVGIIHGGQGVNIVPESCQIEIDIRLVPGQDWRQTYARVQECVKASSQKVEWEFSPTPMADIPFVLLPDHPLVRQAEDVAGSQAQVVSYSCDASKIALAGIPCIIAGPGDIARAHTADESIPVADLAAGVEFYTALARSLLPPQA